MLPELRKCEKFILMRRIYNPVQKDYVTFLETFNDTNGLRTVADVELAPGVSLSNAERDRKAQAVVHHIKSLIGVTCEVVIKAEGEVPRSQGKAVRVKDERGR